MDSIRAGAKAGERDYVYVYVYAGTCDHVVWNADVFFEHNAPNSMKTTPNPSIHGHNLPHWQREPHSTKPQEIFEIRFWL